MSAGDEFRADVRISPCPRGTNKPYLIQGGRMPTLGLAIQVAAWECLVHLWSSEPLLAETREFYYIPARPQPRGEMVQADVSKESDPALINQVAYAIAMTNLNSFLIEELGTTRRNLSRARLHHYLVESTPTLSRRQARRNGLPDPGPSRRVPKQVPILEGVPVSSDLAEEGDVDTTLRLGRTPPSVKGRQAE